MKKLLAAVALSTTILAASPVFAVDENLAEMYECLKQSNNLDSGYAKCYLDQAKRDMAKLSQYYIELANNPKLDKWNNGNKMFKGNFKDLQDAWINSRNRYCSLYAETYSQYDGSDVYFHQSKCLMDITSEHERQMYGLLQTSVATFDE